MAERPQLPDARFGDKAPMNWRDAPDDDEDWDDDEDRKTPPDVTAMLGFDPAEVEDTEP